MQGRPSRCLLFQIYNPHKNHRWTWDMVLLQAEAELSWGSPWACQGLYCIFLSPFFFFKFREIYILFFDSIFLLGWWEIKRKMAKQDELKLAGGWSFCLKKLFIRTYPVIRKWHDYSCLTRILCLQNLSIAFRFYLSS